MIIGVKNMQSLGEEIFVNMLGSLRGPLKCINIATSWNIPKCFTQNYVFIDPQEPQHINNIFFTKRQRVFDTNVVADQKDARLS